MFRKIPDEQRSKIDRSLEHHRVLEADPYICEEDGKNYIIVLYDQDIQEDCVKSDWGLMDDEGIPISIPFRLSPYSGVHQIIQWLKAGRPDDPKFELSLYGSAKAKAKEKIREEFGNGSKDNQS